MTRIKYPFYGRKSVHGAYLRKDQRESKLKLYLCGKRFRDKIYEGLLTKSCIICGETLQRKQKLDGSLEGLSNFLRRKTCGYIWDNNLHKWKKSFCLIQCVVGERNPNWKGIMPRCKDCQKKIAYTGKKGRWIGCERCRDCFLKFAKETNYFTNTPQAKFIAELQRKTKGIQPGHLKIFSFRKGQTSPNKKYFLDSKCLAVNCPEKILAKWLCSKHYRRENKKK